MAKLVVKLPFASRSNTKQKRPGSSADRVRKFRERLKTDPKLKKQLEESKEKKQEENKRYRLKLKEKRQANEQFNDKIKRQERNKKRRQRRLIKQKMERENRPAANDSATKRKISTKKRSAAAIRKRAQRLRNSLPEDPKSWAETVTHVIKNATPRRKSMLPNQMPSYTEEVSEALNLKHIGRPSKEHLNIKKKLAFTQNASHVCGSKRTLRQYKARKSVQGKTLSKAKQYKALWQEKLNSFLEDNSRPMPNKKDTILINGKVVAKRHLLTTKLELYKKFRKENHEFKRKFVTFLTMIPRNYKKLDLTCRRVCVCTKCYNVEKKVEALNKMADLKSLQDLKATPRQLSNISLCPYEELPGRACIDRVCENCGPQLIQCHLQTLLEKCIETDVVKYYQWEQTTDKYYDKEGKQKAIKRWVQNEKSSTTTDLVLSINNDMKSFSGHLFRSDYQHKMEKNLISDLPIDQCVVVMDFSENISLEAQDQIESAHWTTKQITLHPIYIVRHNNTSTEDAPVLKKESLIILSDSLAHNANTVFVFTKQLIQHLKNNPGPREINLIHRFSDNCAQQYKCISAFSHISQLQDSNEIKIIYHFTEAGHGKGPSDGLGAVIKKKVERMILGGKVINNAYQAYLALTQNQQNQRILYVPQRKIQKEMPLKHPNMKSVKGTQSYHMIRYQATANGDKLICQDLSCSCTVCILGREGPCYYSQYRHDPHHHEMDIRQDNSACNVEGGGLGYASQNDDVDLNSVMMESVRENKDHRERVEEEIRLFSEGIKTKGWTIRGETPKDGNCLFWAVSDQLQCVDENYTQAALREMTVKSMADYPQAEKAEMVNFLTDSVDTYLERMGHDGTYADHVCIQALSRLLRCKIHIVQSHHPDIVLSPLENPRASLVIGYLPQIKHYVSLEPLHRIQPDDFVTISLSKGKKRKMYLAKIVQVQPNDELQVRFLKATDTAGVYTWPPKEDLWWHPQGDVISKLKPPELLPGRGILMKFDTRELNESQNLLYQHQ